MTSDVITLTGSIGSGKSTIANQLSNLLRYELYEGGKKFRELAESHNVDILKLNVMADGDKAIDDEIDNWLQGLNNKTNIIVDSRLAWHFVKPSLKVYLQVNEFVAVERIYGKSRTGENCNVSKEALFKDIVLRKQEESLRFKNIYGVDLHNMDNYDIVINTGNKTPSEVVSIILHRRRMFKKMKSKCISLSNINENKLYNII